MRVTEAWKAIPGYAGRYEVSDQGRVRSLDRIIRYASGFDYKHRGQIMRLSPHPKTGHLHLNLCRDGVQELCKVHRLVLAAFVGPCPDGLMGLHWDDDPTNNRLSNLRWGTSLDNARDAARNGGRVRASQCRWGHEYTPENTIQTSRQRACRECANRRSREFRQRNSKGVAA